VSLDRAKCIAAFKNAVKESDPAKRIEQRLSRVPLLGENVYGLAVGKAALAMARGAGEVTHGVCVTHALDGQPLPNGWYALESSHPVPDQRSLAAGDAICDLVATAGPSDCVLALISGGASSLVERPIPGLSLEQFVREVQAVIASGATIQDINSARIARSQIKGGKLGEYCAARITSLIVSDVVDDDPRVIGSGLTCTERAYDSLDVILPMRTFSIIASKMLEREGIRVELELAPLVGRVDVDRLSLAKPTMWWGEPTVAIPPDHGEGGRAQHLALELAQRLGGTAKSAFVIGSDGMDGPPPKSRRRAPAGAFVDGGTWQAMIEAGVNPSRALDRRDAGAALAAVDALVVTGPTGINHGDVVVIG
jgi:glycerate 2-kinase